MGDAADDVPGLDEPGLAGGGEGVVSEHCPVSLYGCLFYFGEVFAGEGDAALGDDE